MNPNPQQQTQAGGNPASRVQLPEELDQGVWLGGGREPIHPDDIGDDGEYLGKDIQLQQRRSTDTSDD
jgi:hypothetical protein